MRSVVETGDAPKAIGPYSQAIRVEAKEMVFLSGQIGLDPATGEIVPGGVEAEARRVMENLRGVLGAAGCTFADVVRTTIYLVDMADFTKVNAIYGAYFPSQPPARATVQVAALPRGAKVEVDAIAVR